MFVEFIYQKTKYQKTMKLNVLYLILANGIVKSFTNWQFATPSVILALLLLNILFKERNQKDDKGISIWNDRKSRGIESIIMNYYRAMDKTKNTI